MKNLTFLLIIAFFVSCETVVQIELPDEPKRIVVNALVAADSTWLLRISSSKGPLEEENFFNRFKPIDEAQLTLKDDEGNQFELKYTSFTPDYIDCEFDNCDQYSYFASTSKALENKAYTLEVSANGFPSVKSQFSIPERVEIDAVEFGEANQISSDYYAYLETNGSITFNDAVNEANYYVVEAYQSREQYFYQYDAITGETIIADTSYYYDNVYLASPDPSVINSGIDDIDYFLLINDNLINGNEVKLNFTAELNFDYDPTGSIVAPKRVVVFLKHISEDYYNYLLTYENYIYSSDNPFAEPVQIASNVENGLGMIATYASDTVGFELEK